MSEALALERTLLLFVIVFLVAMISGVGSETDASESDALLRFKNSLANTVALASWQPPTSPCNGNSANWKGVQCNKGHVWGLRLEGMGLAGRVDVDSLLPLRYLRRISLMNNDFEGPLPEFGKLGSLKSLFLSDNRFSGEIPDGAFEGMGRLKKLHLSNNMFTGKIPQSLTTLPRLLELRLNGNQFNGRLPEFKQDDLKLARLENNDFEGPIPESLRHMDPGSFSGNSLCGPPLRPCQPPLSPPPDQPANSPPAKEEKQLSSFFTLSMVLIVMGSILVIIAIAIFVLQWRKRKCVHDQATLPAASVGRTRSEKSKVSEASCAGAISARRLLEHRLIFVRDSMAEFDLQDLLKASAEVLGSGTFGASYKAVVGGQAVVVKRYRQMNNVGRTEFHEHMKRLGNLNHPNVLPLAAYYYRREEKLLVTEFIENTCLANQLHGNHKVDEPGMDWPTRLKIIKGVTSGLAYLYSALPMLTIPHGHLKSSNVLLDESFEPLLTDHALRPVTNAEHAHMLMSAYKAPEYTQKGVTTRKTDVWCLGILILEILTGKIPENYLTQGYRSDVSLATWVRETVKEKGTREVFDSDMKVTRHGKGQMIKMLKIGLSCSEEDEERRPEMCQVAEMVKEIREGGSYEEDVSCNGSDGDISV